MALPKNISKSNVENCVVLVVCRICCEWFLV